MAATQEHHGPGEPPRAPSLPTNMETTECGARMHGHRNNRSLKIIMTSSLQDLNAKLFMPTSKSYLLHLILLNLNFYHSRPSIAKDRCYGMIHLKYRNVDCGTIMQNDNHV